VLSVLGILISAQQIAVLNLIEELPESSSSRAGQPSKETIQIVRRYVQLISSEIKQQGPGEEVPYRADGLGIWRPR